MAAGVLLAAIYGLFVIWLRANQIVAGTAINMLALGLTPFLCKVLYDVTGQTPAIPMAERFQSAPLYLSWIMVGVCWLWLKHTRGGLWVSFAGEHPEALDAAGVRVNRVRWAAVLVSGALAGMGGASLSVFLASSFSRNMTAGRGFMALAALIFGKVEAGADGHRLPAVWFCRGGADSAPGCQPVGRQAHPGSIHPDSPVSGNHPRAGRLRGPLAGAQSPGHRLPPGHRRIGVSLSKLFCQPARFFVMAELPRQANQSAYPPLSPR